jgi:hypothetical protein
MGGTPTGHRRRSTAPPYLRTFLGLPSNPKPLAPPVQRLVTKAKGTAAKKLSTYDRRLAQLNREGIK